MDSTKRPLAVLCEQAQAALAGLAGGWERDGSALALWEIRAQWVERGGDPPRIDLDGGVRWEWGPPGDPERWAFVAGAPPEFVTALGLHRPGKVDRRETRRWDDAVAAVVAALRRQAAVGRERLRRAAADLAAAGRTPLEPGRVEVHLRVRAWRRAGEPPRGATETGVGVGLAWEHAGAKVRWERWIDAGEPTAPGPPGGEGWWRPAEAAVRFPPAATAVPGRLPRRSLPVVLLPAAAGWWAHELGHVALETGANPAPPARTSSPGSLLLEDDPAAAPWPVGFGFDDLAAAAGRAILWDGAGPRRAGPGHARRAGIGAPARPALTATRLSAPAGTRPPPDAAVALRSVTHARFDPAGGRLLLASSEMGLLTNGHWAPLPDPVVVEMEPREAWASARAIEAGPPAMAEVAACTRLGARLPVRVEAPAVAIESPCRLIVPGARSRDRGER
jgi:hypothetical protein